MGAWSTTPVTAVPSLAGSLIRPVHGPGQREKGTEALSPRNIVSQVSNQPSTYVLGAVVSFPLWVSWLNPTEPPSAVAFVSNNQVALKGSRIKQPELKDAGMESLGSTQKEPEA